MLHHLVNLVKRTRQHTKAHTQSGKEQPPQLRTRLFPALDLCLGVLVGSFHHKELRSAHIKGGKERRGRIRTQILPLPRRLMASVERSQSWGKSRLLWEKQGWGEGEGVYPLEHPWSLDAFPYTPGEVPPQLLQAHKKMDEYWSPALTNRKREKGGGELPVTARKKGIGWPRWANDHLPSPLVLT